MSISNNKLSSHRSRHLAVKDMRVQEHVARERLRVKWCGTREQQADVLTKVLPGPALKDMRDKLNLRD